MNPPAGAYYVGEWQFWRDLKRGSQKRRENLEVGNSDSHQITQPCRMPEREALRHRLRSMLISAIMPLVHFNVSEHAVVKMIAHVANHQVLTRPRKRYRFHSISCIRRIGRNWQSARSSRGHDS